MFSAKPFYEQNENKVACLNNLYVFVILNQFHLSCRPFLIIKGKHLNINFKLTENYDFLKFLPLLNPSASNLKAFTPGHQILAVLVAPRRKFEKTFSIPNGYYLRTLPTFSCALQLRYNKKLLCTHHHSYLRAGSCSVYVGFRCILVYFSSIYGRNIKKCVKYFSTLCFIFVQFHFISNYRAVRLWITQCGCVFYRGYSFLTPNAYFDGFLHTFWGYAIELSIFFSKNLSKMYSINKNSKN